MFMASPMQTAGHSHGHVFATFKRRFLTNGTRNRGGGWGDTVYIFIYLYYDDFFLSVPYLLIVPTHHVLRRFGSLLNCAH